MAASASEISRIPLVCTECGQVHRVELAALAQTQVTCPSCGHARATAQIVSALPRALAQPRPRHLILA